MDGSAHVPPKKNGFVDFLGFSPNTNYHFELLLIPFFFCHAARRFCVIAFDSISFLLSDWRLETQHITWPQRYCSALQDFFYLFIFNLFVFGGGVLSSFESQPSFALAGPGSPVIVPAHYSLAISSHYLMYCHWRFCIWFQTNKYRIKCVRIIYMRSGASPFLLLFFKPKVSARPKPPTLSYHGYFTGGAAFHCLLFQLGAKRISQEVRVKLRQLLTHLNPTNLPPSPF